MSANQDPTNEAPVRSFPYPWVTETGVTAFFLLAVVMLVVRDDLDPVSRYISEYAVGSAGLPMRAGFVLLGLASLNLVPRFIGEDPTLAGNRRIGRFLAVWSLSVLAAAAFPVDPQGAAVTPTGAVHLVASLVGFAALFVSMAVAARRFEQSASWRSLTRLTRAVAILTPVVFVLETTVFSTTGWVGVGQWLLFALAGGWLVALARHSNRLDSSR